MGSKVFCFVSLCCALLSGGCGTVGGEAFVHAYATGDRAYSAGRFDEAAGEYEKAAEIAERDRDKEEAIYAEGDSLFRAGKLDAALKVFDGLAATRPPGERTYFAAFRAARIRIARGDTKAGYAALEAIMKEAPEEGIAHRALFEVVKHVEEASGKAAAIAYEEALFPAVAETDLGEELLYDASTRKAELGSASAALEGFLACAKRYPYPKGALWDDALWHASLLHEQLGDAKAAVEDLRGLLAVREHSDLMGSYDRPRMPYAQLRIGELERDRLNDHAAAQRDLHAVYDDFPKSLLRARAIFEEARLAKDDGNDARACELAELLVEELWESRYARRADQVCPSVAPKVEALKAKKK